MKRNISFTLIFCLAAVLFITNNSNADWTWPFHPDKAKRSYWLALRYYDSNRFSDAIPWLNTAIENDARYAPAWALRGRCYLHSNKPESAIADLNQAALLAPSELDILIDRSQANFALDRSSLAISDLTEVLNEDASLSLAWKLRGKYRFLINDDAEALNDLTNSAQLNPNDADVFFMRAELLRRLGRDTDSILDYGITISLDPLRPKPYLARAELFSAQKLYPAVITELNGFIRLESQNETAYFMRGIAHKKLNHLTDAIKDFNQCEKINSNYFFKNNGHAERGPLFYFINEDTRALIDINRALNENSNQIELVKIRGMLLARLNEHKMAIADFSEYLKFNRELDILRLRALSYLELELYPQARADFKVVADNVSGETLSFFNIGIIDFNDNKFSSAIDNLSTALKTDSNILQAYLIRGIASFRLQKFDKAIADLSKYLSYNKKDLSALSFRAKCYYEKNEFEKAINDFSAIFELGHHDAELYLLRARAYIALGDEIKAVPDYSKYLQIYSSDAAVHFERALSEIKLERHREAINDLDILCRPSTPDTIVFFLRAQSKFKMKDYIGAAEDYTEVIARDMINPEIFFQRARCFKKTRDFERMNFDLEKVFQLDSSYKNRTLD